VRVSQDVGVYYYCTPAQVIGAIRGRFINSFTRWWDITQPNYYH